VRGAVKSFGGRLPKCTAGAFHKKVAEHLPGELTSALEPILETIASLRERIKDYDGRLKDVAEELYPETKLLRQVHGVGVLSALAFVLTLEDPSRASPKAARLELLPGAGTSY
jgi:transposase